VRCCSVRQSRCLSITKLNSSSAHPLDPLSPSEIEAASAAVREYVANLKDGEPRPEHILFNTITLYEPPKAAVLKWSGVIPVQQLSEPFPALVRQAEVHLDSGSLSWNEVC
jgi:Cu2+-containing amine oxidase